LLEYGVSPEENERFGLPCGGRMKIFIEPLTASHLADIRRLLLALDERRAMRRQVDLQSGDWSLQGLEHCQALSLGETTLQQDFGPRFQLLLVGANELARCIAELALAMDYRVLVCDPRDDRRQRWSLPAVTVLPGMPDDVVAEHAADAHSIVITLTHDPRIDDMALMQALCENCYYVGALGSLRTSEKRRQRLLQLDLSAEQIDRLHAPVGLPIGSKSAMEIAVAVMAELTQLRSGKRAV
jgi:xanthine dehydrogenase accessory factor